VSNADHFSFCLHSNASVSRKAIVLIVFAKGVPVVLHDPDVANNNRFTAACRSPSN